MGLFGDWFSKALYDAGIDAPGARAYARKEDEKIGGALQSLWRDEFERRNQAAMAPYQNKVRTIENTTPTGSMADLIGAAINPDAYSPEELAAVRKYGQDFGTAANIAKNNLTAAQQVYGTNPMDALQGLTGSQKLRALPLIDNYYQARVRRFAAGGQPSAAQDGASPVMRNFTDAMDKTIQTHGKEYVRNWIKTKQDDLRQRGIDPDTILGRIAE